MVSFFKPPTLCKSYDRFIQSGARADPFCFLFFLARPLDVPNFLSALRYHFILTDGFWFSRPTLEFEISEIGRCLESGYPNRDEIEKLISEFTQIQKKIIELDKEKQRLGLNI